MQRVDHVWGEDLFNQEIGMEFRADSGEVYVGYFQVITPDEDSGYTTAFIHLCFLLQRAGIRYK